MRKIALIKLPPTYANWYLHPTLSLAYLSSFLSHNKYECKIFDAYFFKWTKEELLLQITSFCPDILGITAMTHEIDQAALLAKQLKKTIGKTIVVGGPHITALPEKTMNEYSSFDFGVFGEGEYTFLELLNFIFDNSAKRSFSSINGLVYRNNSSVIVNKARKPISDLELNKLPFPAYYQYYGDSKGLSDKKKSYVIFSSRGCPYKCAFCMQVLGNCVRSFCPERICDEIEFAIERYGAHTINFWDEIFLFDNKRTRTLLQMIIDKGLHKKIKWSGLTRANMVNEKIISLAKEAGCYMLEMGVESGDDAILKDINKKITVKQIENAVRIIKKYKIYLGTYYILGHPNETKETINKTINLAVKLNTDIIAVGLMTPYPGTDIFNRAIKGKDGYKLLSRTWSDYDKYGGRALSLKNLTFEELCKYQKLAYFKFYLKNFKILEILKFLWKRRHAFIYFFKKKYLKMLTL